MNAHNLTRLTAFTICFLALPCWAQDIDTSDSKGDVQHTAPPTATLAQPAVKDVESNASKTRAPAALGTTQLKAQPIPLSPTTMSGSQKVIAGLAGFAGIAVGGISGGITGFYFHDGIVCGTFKQGCGYREEKNPIGNAGGFIGIRIGATAGQALGTYAYGESVGLQGSYWSTLGWTAAYDATLFGASLLAKNESRETIQLVGLIGSLFVSVWAYESSLESTSSTSTVSQTPSKGLNFGVPTVSFDHHNGDRRFTLNLTGGQF
jgi:hypothetical protein